MLYTIGFTKKSAEEFFELLKKNNVKKLIDVRLNNKSQLAGFAKGRDLEYFLKEIMDIEYSHRVEFSPSKELLDGYKKGSIPWEEYEDIYVDLIIRRGDVFQVNKDDIDDACLLCSEATPEHCHRRLLAERLSSLLDVSISHL